MYGIGIKMLAVYLLRAEHQIGKRQREQGLDLFGGPALGHLRTGGRRKMDDLGMHDVKSGGRIGAETAKPAFSAKTACPCCTA